MSVGVVLCQMLMLRLDLESLLICIEKVRGESLAQANPDRFGSITAAENR